MTRRLTVTGSTMRPRTARRRRAVIAQSLLAQGLAACWKAGHGGPGDPRRPPAWPQAPEAHRLMESSAHIGKIVMTVS